MLSGIYKGSEMAERVLRQMEAAVDYGVARRWPPLVTTTTITITAWTRTRYHSFVRS